MEYSEKVIEHFSSPRNVGEIPDADGVGMIGSPECGDVLKVWIKVEGERLADIKYKVFGCPAAIASCSMMTELAIGMHIRDAYDLTDAKVAQTLGGLPDQKLHCSNLAASTLHKAITGYLSKRSGSDNSTTLTVLTDNTGLKGFACEHGLSLLIEHAGRQILFDTGQSNIVVGNAGLLGTNLAGIDAIVLSHGHYDHTGGLAAVLDIAPRARIYLHPEAVRPKFSRKYNRSKAIGMPDSAEQAIRRKADEGEVAWTDEPTEVCDGLYVTSRIPRTTDFEDVGGNFFADAECRKPDLLPDDQAVFFESPKGLIVILGCAHSGVVNTLHYAFGLSAAKSIHAVVGGMHLLNASEDRIKHTIDFFREHDVKKIGLAHCTGSIAGEKFKQAFPTQCFACSAGMTMNL